jgi:hypothetical protein
VAQLQTKTWINRYPDVFRTVQMFQSQYSKSACPRILSFGCSSGQELQSIKNYFPTAAIFGCDVNRAALAEAAKVEGCTVFLSTPEAIKAFAPFDIIFAMSVLCRFSLSQNARSLKSVFPFSEFEDHLGVLDGALSDNGLLCIQNANYLFSQSSFYRSYAPVRCDLIGTNGFVDKWTADDIRISSVQKFKHGREHKIESQPDFLTDWDFRDVVFRKNATAVTELAGTPAPIGRLISMNERGADLSVSAAERRIANRHTTELLQDEAGSMWVGSTLSKTTLSGKIVSLPTWWSYTHPEPAGQFTPVQKQWVIKSTTEPKYWPKRLLPRWWI